MQEYKQQVLDFFIKQLNSRMEDYSMSGFLNGLRGFVGLFGPDLVKPHEELIKKQQQTGGSMMVKDTATDLLNDLAGRRYVYFGLTNYLLYN